MALSENIKRIRKEKGLTQKKLGELCNIDEANIRKYENGKQTPKIETLEKIANALQCSVDGLMGMPKALDLIILPLDELIAKYITTSRTNLKQLAEKTSIPINKLQKIEQGELFSSSNPLRQMILSGEELDKLTNTLNIPSTEIRKSILVTQIDTFNLPNQKVDAELASHIAEYEDSQKNIYDLLYNGDTELASRIAEYEDSQKNIYDLLYNSDTKLASHIKKYNDITKEADNKKIENETSLAEIESLFCKLNANGKKEIYKRLEELTHLKQYTDK